MGEREERFARLFASAYGPLWTYARRRVQPDDVDDIVAETLTTAWRRLDDIPSGDGALPWLYGVAYRTVANHHRSATRRLRLVDKLRREPPGATDGNPAVLDTLAELRPDDQELLRLAAWEGLGVPDIARVLGCSTNAAALRLSRARKRFRARLTGSGSSRTSTGRKEIDV